ncbi:MAG: ATPase [Acidimicrobiia bacterium]
MRTRLTNVLLVAAGWACLALLFSPQTYLLNQGRAPISWSQAVLANATTFAGWALLTPLVVLIGRRWAIERGYILRAVAVHAGAALALAALHLFIVQALQVAMSGGARPPRPLTSLWVGYGATNVLVYCGVAAITQAVIYFRRDQERAYRLEQARLRALRAQLQPHFLFNTINAIAELIHVDPGRAEMTLTQLADLLRQGVDVDQPAEVALTEELAWARKYVAICETLLQERLRVEWDIPVDTHPAAVPAMLLQPLIENAIRHGIAPRPRGGTITIRAQRVDDRLRLDVEDDGVGVAAGVNPLQATGVGLANVRARLASLHATRASLSVQASPSGGAVATVTVPWRDAS